MQITDTGAESWAARQAECCEETQQTQSTVGLLGSCSILRSLQLYYLKNIFKY